MSKIDDFIEKRSTLSRRESAPDAAEESGEPTPQLMLTRRGLFRVGGAFGTIALVGGISAVGTLLLNSVAHATQLDYNCGRYEFTYDNQLSGSYGFGAEMKRFWVGEKYSPVAYCLNMSKICVHNDVYKYEAWNSETIRRWALYRLGLETWNKSRGYSESYMEGLLQYIIWVEYNDYNDYQWGTMSHDEYMGYCSPCDKSVYNSAYSYAKNYYDSWKDYYEASGWYYTSTTNSAYQPLVTFDSSKRRGYLTIWKTWDPDDGSLDRALNNPDRYDLNGAKFGIYTDANCTNKAISWSTGKEITGLCVSSTDPNDIPEENPEAERKSDAAWLTGSNKGKYAVCYSPWLLPGNYWVREEAVCKGSETKPGMILGPITVEDKESSSGYKTFKNSNSEEIEEAVIKVHVVVENGTYGRTIDTKDGNVEYVYMDDKKRWDFGTIYSQTTLPDDSPVSYKAYLGNSVSGSAEYRDQDPVLFAEGIGRSVTVPVGTIDTDTCIHIYYSQEPKPEPVKGSFAGMKVSADLVGNDRYAPNSPLGDGNLCATFGLYKDGELIAQTVADRDGTFSFADIEEGSYEVREIQTSLGYLINSAWSYSFVVGEGEQNDYLDEIVCEEQTVKHDLRLVKSDSDNLGANQQQGDAILQGAIFGLYNVSQSPIVYQGSVIPTLGQGSVPGESERPFITFVSGKNGYIEVRNLPYGTYWLRELEAPTGYNIPAHLQRGVEVIVHDTVEIPDLNAYENIWYDHTGSRLNDETGEPYNTDNPPEEYYISL